MGGKPNELYHHPEKFGVIDCRKEVNNYQVDILRNTYATKPTLYSKGFLELVSLVMPHVSFPCSIEEAYHLYFDIINRIKSCEDLSIYILQKLCILCKLYV